jgi:hypothetical protein
VLLKTQVKPGEVKRLKRSDPSEKDVESSKEKVKNAREEKTLLDLVEEDLEENFVFLPNNENIADEYLTLPVHLDEVTDVELGRYLHATLQQRMWVRTLLARVTLLIKAENNKLDKEKDRVFSMQDKKMSVTEKELKLYNDPVCSCILSKIEYLEGKRDILSAVMENLEDARFDISRNIALLGIDFDGARRADNVENIRRGKRG